MYKPENIVKIRFYLYAKNNTLKHFIVHKTTWTLTIKQPTTSFSSNASPKSSVTQLLVFLALVEKA